MKRFFLIIALAPLTASAQANYSYPSSGSSGFEGLIFYIAAFIISILLTRWIFGITKMLELQKATANELYTIRLELKQVAKERAEEKHATAALELQLLEYRYKSGSTPAEEYAIRKAALQQQMNNKDQQG